ncbi:hypothetical protein V8C35DRAFT_316934 [Trichoderma chlorosporum]
MAEPPFRADRMFQHRRYVWRDEERKKEREREREKAIYRGPPEVLPCPRIYLWGKPRTREQLIEMGLWEVARNQKDNTISEEDDPEALLECTQKEWELSVDRCYMKAEDGTIVEALLKEEEVFDKEIPIFPPPSPTKEEDKEECSGKHNDMQATELLLEKNESVDGVICVKDEIESSESKIYMNNALIGEEDEEGSTRTTNAPSERSLDALILHVRNQNLSRKRKRSLDEDSGRECKRQ